MTIPINESILFYIYQAIGIDPNNCSQFVSDMIPVFACVVLCLFCIGCFCTFRWFYKLMKWR